jgi:four helix bundle protein
MMERKFDLEERLIRFSVEMIKIAESLPRTFAGNHLAGQLIRSGTAPALQYGEAVGAESRNDFIHKMKIALKELRETNNCLKIIYQVHWINDSSIMSGLKECNELIAIFVKSIATAQRNKQEMKEKQLRHS